MKQFTIAARKPVFDGKNGFATGPDARNLGSCSKMIRPGEPRVPHGEERVEKLEGLVRARPDEVSPGELPRGEVAGVELGELAHVERDALFGFGSANYFALPDGVLVLVLRYDVVFYVEDERLRRREVEVAQGRRDVDQAQHLVGLDDGLYVRASEVRVERLAARRRELYPVNVDRGVEARQKGEERLVGPRCGGDQLVHPEGPPRVLVLP